MNATAAPNSSVGEIGDFRPFAQARVVACVVMLAALPLLFAKRHHRPLDRRPLFMRGCATVLFCAQSLTRAFVAVCWVTTCLAWLLEIAMVLAVVAHAWQCYASFRLAQIQTELVDVAGTNAAVYLITPPVNASADDDNDGDANLELAKQHAMFRHWGSTRATFSVWLLFTFVVWALEVSIGARLVGSIEGVTLFSRHAQCDFLPFRFLNSMMGVAEYLLMFVLCMLMFVAYRRRLGSVPDSLHIKSELKLMLVLWIIQVLLATALALLNIDFRRVIWAVLQVLLDATTIWRRIADTFRRQNRRAPEDLEQPIVDDEELTARRPSSNTRERFPIRALEMELARTSFRERFRVYLEAELTNELLMFAEKALALLNEKQFGHMLSCGSMQTIYAEFLAPAAPIPINVSAAQRTNFAKELENDPESDKLYDCLRSLYIDVMSLLAFGRLPSFLLLFDDDESSFSQTEYDESWSHDESSFHVLARYRRMELENAANTAAAPPPRETKRKRRKQRAKPTKKEL